MKDKLNRALTNIDERLIDEAANAEYAERRGLNTALKIALPIGAAAAVAGAVVLTQPLWGNSLSTSSGIELNTGDSGAAGASGNYLTAVLPNGKERLSALFGTEAADGQTRLAVIEQSEIEANNYASRFPSIICEKQDIVVFTDEFDSSLFFYDIADYTPESERMAAQLDLVETVNLLQKDPANGLLPTIGKDKWSDSGICVNLYNKEDKPIITVDVTSYDGEQSKLSQFRVGFLDETPVLTRLTEAEQAELQALGAEAREQDSFTVMPRLIGDNLSSYRLVKSTLDTYRVFDPYGENTFFQAEEGGASIAIYHNADKREIYLYNAAAPESEKWCYDGDFSVDGDRLYANFYLTENYAPVITAEFIVNHENGELKISSAVLPDLTDFANKDGEPSIHLPSDSFKAGTVFVPVGDTVDFLDFVPDFEKMAELALEEFPKLKSAVISQQFTEDGTRIVMDAYIEVTAEQQVSGDVSLSEQECEDIRQWLYQQTGDNHPIINLNYQSADCTELENEIRAAFPTLENVSVIFGDAGVVLRADSNAGVHGEVFAELEKMIFEATSDNMPDIRFNTKLEHYYALEDAAEEQFPELLRVSIYKTLYIDGVRTTLSAEIINEISEQRREEIREWIYNQTGDTHPILDILLADPAKIIQSELTYLRDVAFSKCNVGEDGMLCLVTSDTLLTDVQEDEVRAWVKRIYPDSEIEVEFQSKIDPQSAIKMLEDLEYLHEVGFASGGDGSLSMSANVYHNELTPEQLAEVRSILDKAYPDNEVELNLNVVEPLTGELTMPIDGLEYGFDYYSDSEVATAGANEVYTVADGQIIAAEWIAGYGNTVIVMHEYCLTMYSHLNSISVNVGDKVNAGDTLGIIGSTGTIGVKLGYRLLDAAEYYAICGLFRSAAVTNDTDSQTSEMCWPVGGTGGQIVEMMEGFGGYSGHSGIDIADELGTPILAADSGKVIFAEQYLEYGNCVMIEHSNDSVTVYAHLGEIKTSVGEQVTKGQQIGDMGDTGYVTGSVLHFEVRVGDVCCNPLNYLPEHESASEGVEN